MIGFEVTPVRVRDASSFVDGHCAELRAELQSLVAQMDSTLWRGSAASAFRIAWDEWLDGARCAVRALDAMADALDASARSYAGAEAETVASL